MTFIERVTAILLRTEFRLGEPYRFDVREGHGGVFMQAIYNDRDIYTNTFERQHTRKWLLSPSMTDSEIVQTAFKCALTSAEHRAREAFTYRGARIFGPHFDVEDLVKLCADREDAGGRKPPETH